jgi:hypothetical protein
LPLEKRRGVYTLSTILSTRRKQVKREEIFGRIGVRRFRRRDGFGVRGLLRDAKSANDAFASEAKLVIPRDVSFPPPLRIRLPSFHGPRQ